MLKKIIIIIVLIYPSFVFSDDPCQLCRDKYDGVGPFWQIPYYYCDPINHKIVSICTRRGPYNPPEPYSGWQPMKLCLPLTYGEDVIYDDSNIPWADLGPWTEQTGENEYDNTFEFNYEDIPGLIDAALGFWQNICDHYNNENCQSCSIKIYWAKDEQDLEGDKLLPSHVSNPLISDGCEYDCSKMAIVLNGTRNIASVSTDGKPNHFFFTRGTKHYSKYLVNSDLRTEMIHQLGILLGIGNINLFTDGYCGFAYSVMSSCEDEAGYWEFQEFRITALDESSSMNPPYEFVPNQDDSWAYDYDQCSFRLLYCYEPEVSVQEDSKSDFPLFAIMPNPVSSSLNIKFCVSETQFTDLAIYNLVGERLISIIKNEYLEPNNYSIDVNLNFLSSGTYYCVYKKSDQIYSRLFIYLH